MAEQLRDGFVWRCLDPVDGLVSLASEGTAKGAPLAKEDGRGVAYAAMSARAALFRDARFMEASSSGVRELVARGVDLRDEVGKILPAYAAAALIGTGQYGADICDALGLEATDFAEAMAFLGILFFERYKPEKEGDSDG